MLQVDNCSNISSSDCFELNIFFKIYLIYSKDKWQFIYIQLYPLLNQNYNSHYVAITIEKYLNRFCIITSN